MANSGGAIDPPPGPRASGFLAGAASAVAPLRRPLFAGVWTANTVSNFGGQVQAVGAAWLMTSLTREPDTIALVSAAAMSPILLFSLLAGAVADTYDRRLILLAAQGLMLTASALLAWLALIGMIAPSGLIVLTFVIGSGFAFNAPAWQATVRELVPDRAVPAAISLNIMGFNLSRTAGPALGGIVVAWGGVHAAFAFNALSYLGLMGVLLFWLTRRRPRAAQAGGSAAIVAAIRAGIAHAWGSHELRRILLRVASFGLALGALLALVPIVIRNLSAGPTGMGLAFGASGAGAVLGALLAEPLKRWMGVEAMVRLAMLITAASMAAVATGGTLGIVACAEAVTGFTTTLVYTSLNVLVQAAAPRPLLARLLSIHQMSAFGGLAAGGWLWGSCAAYTGTTIAILGAASVMALLVAVTFVVPLADAPVVAVRR